MVVDTIPDTTAVATASVVQNSTEIEITKEMYDRLRLDLQLKAADNRFLQEELDNKDRMLAMLTDGLKEVYFPALCISL